MLLPALLVAAQLAAPSAAGLGARFGARHYVVAGREVPVGARPDMLVLRTALAPADAAVLVERAANEKAPDARVSGARFVRARDGLVVVELADAVAPRVLRALAAQVLADAGDGVLHVYPALARMTGRAFYDEQLVVTAAPGRLDDVVRAVLDKTGGALVKKSAVPYTALVAVGEAPFAWDAVDASAALARMDIAGLVSAEPNLYREIAPRAVVPNDPLFAQQWHLSRQPGTGIPGAGQIFADVAWDTTRGDPGVVVAVFDTGIETTHPDLAANMLAGFDAAADDADPRPECSAQFDGRDVVQDCPSATPFKESHGTCVSGTIAAVADNGIGVSGVCPLCSILPVRLLGDEAATGLGIAETFIRGVDLGADVINNSWGPGFSLFFPLSTAEGAAFAYAKETGRDGLGTVILFAAGNDTADVAGDAYASNPQVITVAASTNIDDWAEYSDFGAEVDVAAPSQGLPAQQDGIPDDDFGILTTDLPGDDGYDPGDYNSGFNGTSAASPVAAGVAALVIATNPQLTSDQVRLVLTRSADKILADKIDWVALIGQDVATLFAYDDTGHSIGFGYGRVNAARAVALATDPGLEGAFCNAVGCQFCSADHRCLERCTTQADCVDGSVCNAALGACELPRDRPADFLSPCSSDCAFCTPTLDSQFAPASICTISCASDDDCPDGFDCRAGAFGGPDICGVGDKGAGNPADFFDCFSPQIGSAIVTVAGGGRNLCSDICFADAPGACPHGFTCGEADCTCTAPTNFGCFEFTCGPDDRPGVFDVNDFQFPVCLPDPGWADVCTGDLECQLGDYCKGGHCALDDRDGCDVCKTCGADTDCVGRGRCIGLRDDGVGECAWACDDTDPCPGDSVCRHIASQFGQLAVCLSPHGDDTQEPGRCDPSYSCTVACRDDVPCPTGQACDAGTCKPAAPPPDDTGPPGVSGGGCSACNAGGVDPSALALTGAVLAVRWRRRWRAS